MLNPSAMVDAIASTLQAIPDLTAAMTVLDVDQNPVCRIAAFHYRLGQEHRLAEAIYKMPAPSMLLAWDGTQGGNFDGQTIWKHRFSLYFRMGNAAGLTDPVGYEELWWIVCNKPPTGSQVNIRYMQLYPGLDIMDAPSVAHALDEDLQDRFVCTLVIPEIGDN
jgi:hypothetical protein